MGMVSKLGMADRAFRHRHSFMAGMSLLSISILGVVYAARLATDRLILGQRSMGHGSTESLVFPELRLDLGSAEDGTAEAANTTSAHARDVADSRPPSPHKQANISSSPTKSSWWVVDGLVHGDTGSRIRNGFLKLEPKRHLRLGNQLSMFAASLTLAERNKKIFVIEWNDGLKKLQPLFQLGLREPITKKKNKFSEVREEGANIFTEKLFHLDTGNWKVNGFFQSYKYVHGYETALRNRLELKTYYAMAADSILQKIISSQHEDNSLYWFVGIHVRRGDRTHVSPPPEYYKDAIAYMLKHGALNGRKTILIVSSEPKELTWCRHNINSGTENGVPVPVHYISNEDERVDFAVLANCNATIISVGTFGWWAGWISGGPVVYYKEWPAKHQTDHYPPTWVGF